jgi:uncharacterized protein (DUF697 family)
MDGVLYTILLIFIGIVLLFFGLKLMKIAVTIMGFILGFSITSSLIAPLQWPELTVTLIAIGVGILLATVAFAFYKFAITTTIALFFANFTFTIAQSLGQGATESLILAFIVGILAFIAVVALRLVDVLFALSTSAQGAYLVVVAVYAALHSTQLDTVQQTGLTGVSQAAWLWGLGWLVVTLIGFVFQLKGHKSPPQPHQGA